MAKHKASFRNHLAYKTLVMEEFGTRRHIFGQ